MARLASNLDDSANTPERVYGVVVTPCNQQRVNHSHDADVVRRMLARWIAQQIVAAVKEKP